MYEENFYIYILTSQMKYNGFFSIWFLNFNKMTQLSMDIYSIFEA